MASSSCGSASSACLSVSSSVNLGTSVPVTHLVLSPGDATDTTTMPPTLLVNPTGCAPVCSIPSGFFLVLASRVPSDNTTAAPSMEVTDTILEP